MEVGPVDAGFVGGFDIAGAGGGAGVEEVAEELGGGVVVGAAEFEGALFECALESDAAEGIGGVGMEVAGADIDHEAGVGVGFGAGVGAHAIGDDAAGFGGGGDDEAAGAHAEGVGGAAGAAVGDEFVGGGAEAGVAGVLAVADAVDKGLRVLDADADGEGFGFEGDALGVEGGEGVA